MKKISVVIFLSMLLSVANAQISIGVEGGVSSSSLTTDISNRTATVIRSKIGYSVDIPIEIKIKSWLHLEVLPGLIQKNYSIDRINSFAGVYDTHINRFVQLPIMVKIVRGKRVQISGEIGTFCGRWLSGYLKGRIPDIFSASNINGANGQTAENLSLKEYSEKYMFNSIRDNRYEFGWIMGIGSQYHLSNTYKLLFTFTYSQCLSNMQKEYYVHQAGQYNRTITFSAGSMICF